GAVLADWAVEVCDVREVVAAWDFSGCLFLKGIEMAEMLQETAAEVVARVVKEDLHVDDVGFDLIARLEGKRNHA
ncbi:hypothetical protein, partial [Kingella negevensis]|uniref:hypothetical protein n=1 Tax=Kingella negevensis TaxID=1522312 RepID=UPI002550830E